MKIKKIISFRLYILLTLSIALQVIPALAYEKKSGLNREYQIKAAFLYNFIQFVDWPEEKVPDKNDHIILGIIGEDPFGGSFKPIESKQIKGTKSLIKRFEGIEKLEKSDDKGKSDIESLRKCHLLFICSSENDNLEDIINLVSRHGYFPGLVKLPSEELLGLFCMGEAFESALTVNVTRSKDNGKSWQLQGPLYDDSADDRPKMIS